MIPKIGGRMAIVFLADKGISHKCISVCFIGDLKINTGNIGSVTGIKPMDIRVQKIKIRIVLQCLVKNDHIIVCEALCEYPPRLPCHSILYGCPCVS